MNLLHKMDKEPIELLLGLAGAVQYLGHTTKDQDTYLVRVKTKTGDKQITVPIAAVQQIQSQKPAFGVVDSIKRQLTDDPSSNFGISHSPIQDTSRPKFTLWGRFLRLLGLRN